MADTEVLMGDPRWDPALVKRIVVIRIISAASMGLVIALLPSFGQDRFWLAGVMIVAVPCGTLLVHRFSEPDRVLINATLVDTVWAVSVVQMVPEVYACAMLIGIAMLAFVANEDLKALTRTSAVGVIGFALAGAMQEPVYWVPLIAIYVLLLPLLFFMALTQHEREARHQLRIRHRVEHDVLTGLRNRSGLVGAFEAEPVEAVIVIDLDGFKDINDTLGHEAGDELLRALAIRMSETVGRRGVLARIGGDEFAVAVRTGPAERVGTELLQACRQRIALGDIDVSIGASVGVALATVGEQGPELLRRADLAMYEAKRNQGGMRLWSETTRRASRRRVSLSGEVEQAFERGEFELHFQPIVEMESSRLVDVEGLLRWRHPERGILYPGDFLELIEGIGRRSTMDRVVFDDAAAFAARLPTTIGVSVNVSAGSLLRSSLPLALDDALRRHDVPARRLTIEVIEDELIDEHSTARAVLGALGELGTGIAIDDFGTGHSSLSRLRRLPVSSLKIDRSFVSSMMTSNDDRAIVSAVSELGRALDLLTVAEGVEDLAIRDHMTAHGLRIDRIQGYGIAKPMPADELLAWAETSVGFEASNEVGLSAPNSKRR